MNKKAVLAIIEEALKDRFETAKNAVLQAHQAATSEESVAENKYDTFGLEASYLAHGQSQRVLDCEREWLAFIKVFSASQNDVNDLQKVALWSLVEVVSVEGVIDSKWFLISSFAGGLNVVLDEFSVYLVTPSSPVGNALMGKELEGEIALLQHGQECLYEIASIL
ncbi:hypothetical protein ABFY09_05155 [Marinomonas sp. 5E14-1]|uniref:hypothetical protein n=1 Tax=Marinomonas sp. 5E14-1 TaxID=3153922 RepID=UPI003264B525